MERACLAARERPTEQQAASYLATSGPPSFGSSASSSSLVVVFPFPPFSWSLTSCSRRARRRSALRMSGISRYWKKWESKSGMGIRRCSHCVRFQLLYPGVRSYHSQQHFHWLRQRCLSMPWTLEWTYLSSNSAAPPSPVDMRNVNEVHFPFFLAKLRRYLQTCHIHMKSRDLLITFNQSVLKSVRSLNFLRNIRNGDEELFATALCYIRSNDSIDHGVH